jgi:hypothetical protein
VAPITSPQIPGFQFWVRTNETRLGTAVASCLPQTVCVATATPGRTEVLLRIVPRLNGFLWPHILRFNGPKTEVWIRQVSTGQQKYYSLPAISPGSDALPGLIDRTGFLP